MVKLKDIIQDFKFSLISCQLDTNKRVPISAFANYEEISEFCDKYNKKLVWNNEHLEIAYE